MIPGKISVKDHREVSFHNIHEIQEILLRKAPCDDTVENLPENQRSMGNR